MRAGPLFERRIKLCRTVLLRPSTYCAHESWCWSRIICMLESAQQRIRNGVARISGVATSATVRLCVPSQRSRREISSRILMLACTMRLELDTPSDSQRSFT